MPFIHTHGFNVDIPDKTSKQCRSKGNIDEAFTGEGQRRSYVKRRRDLYIARKR